MIILIFAICIVASIFFSRLEAKILSNGFNHDNAAWYGTLMITSEILAFILFLVTICLTGSVSIDIVLKEKIAFYENELLSEEQTSITAVTLNQQYKT
jgi:hypothetical protein